MMYTDKKGKEWAKPDFVVIEVPIMDDPDGSTELKMLHIMRLDPARKRKADQVRYDLTQFKDRPDVLELFRTGGNYMIMIDCPLNNGNIDKLGDFMRMKEEKEGWIVTILSSFIGAKMGGKKNPVFFMSKKNWMDHWHERRGILKEVQALTWAKRFERDKKILSRISMFDPKPSIRFIPDLPGMDGVAFASPEWMESAGISAGTKMSGPAKDIIYPVPDKWNFGKADLFVQENGNKLKLNTEKFAELAGYDPELVASKRFSRNLVVKVKNGEDFVGRNPNFGLDLQAYAGLMPEVDLTFVKKVLLGNFDDPEVRDTILSFKDKDGEIKLNKLGRDIIEGHVGLETPAIRYQVYTILFKHIQRTLRDRVRGEFGVAAPLSLAPEEAKQYIRERVIVGYSGGIVAKGLAVIHNDVIYVHEETWQAMGRDWDGDLVFIFPFRNFPYPKLISTLDQLKKYYKLPEKSDDSEDTRDKIETICDVLKQSRCVGTYYNNIMVAADAMRRVQIDLREIVNFIMMEMAGLEVNIRALKGHATMTVPKPEDMLEKRFMYEAIPEVEKATWFFYALRSKGWVKIGKRAWHPLDALAIKAQKACKNGPGFWEPLVALFQEFRTPSPKQLEVMKEKKSADEKKDVKEGPAVEQAPLKSKQEVVDMVTMKEVESKAAQIIAQALGFALTTGHKVLDKGHKILDKIAPVTDVYEPEPKVPVKAAKKTEYVVYKVNAVGVTFDDRQSLIEKLDEAKDVLTIKDDRSPEYPQRVGVYAGTTKIGHIPRARSVDSTDYARMIQDKWRKGKHVEVFDWRKVGGQTVNLGGISTKLNLGIMLRIRNER